MGALSFGVVIAVTAAIFVNGATDAPGCVAGAVSSGCISYRQALFICALFNFLGMSSSALLFHRVSDSVEAMIPGADFAVPAALFSVVAFSCAAWYFGVPTSESHGLMGALGGASLYCGASLGGGYFGILAASAASCLIGAVAGAALCALLKRPLAAGLTKRQGALVHSSCAAAEALCHGVQDGQKFLALLYVGRQCDRSASVVLICSAVMAAGSLFGGRRITERLSETIGMGHVAEAVSADVAGSLTTLASSAAGIPISTTYMKSCAIFGASVAGGGRTSAKSFALQLITWFITYPVTMALSYLSCLLWDRIF